MPALALAALLALAADPDPPRPVPRSVSGRIVAVSGPEHSATVAGAEETVKLTFDRNTMVFLESTPGTLADLAVGLQARASASSAGLAYWIEVKPPAGTPNPSGAPTSTATATPTSTPTATPASTATPTPTPAAKPESGAGP